MNLVEIKETLKQIRLCLYDQIESAEMEGDISLTAHLREKLDMFLSAQEELDKLHNTEIIPHFLPKIFAEKVPSLRIDSFWSYVDTLARRTEDEVSKIQGVATRYRSLSNLFREEASTIVSKRVNNGASNGDA